MPLTCSAAAHALYTAFPVLVNVEASSNGAGSGEARTRDARGRIHHRGEIGAGGRPQTGRMPRGASRPEQLLDLLGDGSPRVGAVDEIGGGTVAVRGRRPDRAQVLFERHAGIDARAIDGLHACGERRQVRLEEHDDARPAQRVDVPLVANGAPAERAHRGLERREALADAVLQLSERQPALLANEFVKAPADRPVHLAIEIVERAPEPLRELKPDRGLPAADHAREVDVHRRASSRAARMSSGKV